MLLRGRNSISKHTKILGSLLSPFFTATVVIIIIITQRECQRRLIEPPFLLHFSLSLSPLFHKNCVHVRGTSDRMLIGLNEGPTNYDSQLTQTQGVDLDKKSEFLCESERDKYFVSSPTSNQFDFNAQPLCLSSILVTFCYNEFYFHHLLYRNRAFATKRRRLCL